MMEKTVKKRLNADFLAVLIPEGSKPLTSINNLQMATNMHDKHVVHR